MILVQNKPNLPLLCVGAGVYVHPGVGCEPAGSHCHHQGHAGVQPREGALDRTGGARRPAGTRGEGGLCDI